LTGQVQLQLVTATVKLFLKKPQTTQNIVWRLLQIATSECDNPDIRDRAYVYWRLLSTDPQAAKVIKNLNKLNCALFLIVSFLCRPLFYQTDQ
jgi:vesicle coat complex subunit